VWRRDAAAVGVAGVALGDIHLRFTWQACDFHFCVAAVARMAVGVATSIYVWRRDAAAVGVAGVALGDIHFRFTWQAWYLVTSTSTLAWQAWHLWHWAGSGGALGFRCVAGTPRLLAWQACTALGDIHLRFTWQACDFHFSVAAVARTAVGVAGVALGDIHFRFTWLAWYLVTSTYTFAWQAWHVWQWAGSGGAWVGVEHRDAAAVGVAGVALGDIHLRFTWQSWHLVR